MARSSYKPMRKTQERPLVFFLIIIEFIYFGSTGSSWWSMGSRVMQGLSCPLVCGILVPGPEIEPMSPALASGFLATGPPGKFLHLF